FEEVLKQHDFEGVRLIARLFARKLRRQNDQAAQDLVQRASLRLVRLGWDPNAISLKKRLLRFVWSEAKHERDETAVARRAEEMFLKELEVDEGRVDSPSAEDQHRRLAREKAEEEHAQSKIDALRAIFVKKRDNENLLWLDFTIQGITDLKEMARLSSRPVEDFYNAAKRRKHAVEQLSAAGRAKDEE
ncbi:MAG TPA: hypothetical protein VIF09_14000, partial [Polyangiaceae bacterium]